MKAENACNPMSKKEAVTRPKPDNPPQVNDGVNDVRYIVPDLIQTQRKETEP